MGLPICKIRFDEIENNPVVQILVFIPVEKVLVHFVVLFELGLYEIALVQIAHLHLHLHLHPIIHLGHARYLSGYHVFDFQHSAVGAGVF